jgi:hypothetical protein
VALTRDNHFVQQLYLKNFATDSGEVLEYRILVSNPKVPMWKPVNVAGTGYEKNLYTRIVRGEETDDIEQWLNREFESPAKEPFQKVLADNELTRDDWEILVRFLASQIVRTPAFLIKNLPLWNRMAPVILDQTTKDVEARLREAKESGQRIVYDDAPNTEYFPMKIDRKDLPEEKKVQFTTTLVVGRGMWFSTMKHTLTNTLKVLYRHNWTILEAPARLRWFTSDDPVICLNFRSESDYDFNGGWGRARANILFPLSPRHLMFTEIGESSYPRRVPSCYHARLFRRMIAEHGGWPTLSLPLMVGGGWPTLSLPLMVGAPSLTQLYRGKGGKASRSNFRSTPISKSPIKTGRRALAPRPFYVHSFEATAVRS